MSGSEAQQSLSTYKLPEEKRIHLPGFTLAMKIWNPEKSNPLLCLHGKMDNAASFDFLAPFFSDRQVVAVDCPGTGFSTSYPEGIMPNWKNDALLMLQLIKILGWEQCDILAHSLGSLAATMMAVARPEQVGKIVFLDVLGPVLHFSERRKELIQQDIEYFLRFQSKKRKLFQNQEAAILDRMQTGNISYQAASALVMRGTIKSQDGWHWTFDKRLRCLASTLPYEDELKSLFHALEVPVCLIRAKQGLNYPEQIFQERANAIKNLDIREISGGHHVHMDDPASVADKMPVVAGWVRR